MGVSFLGFCVLSGFLAGVACGLGGGLYLSWELRLGEEGKGVAGKVGRHRESRGDPYADNLSGIASGQAGDLCLS